MAYAALVSLVQTIDHILFHPISVPRKREIMPIRDDAIFLQAFLQDKHISLEGRITEVANNTEDTIKYIMLQKILSDCGSLESTGGPSKVGFEPQLGIVAEKLKSIVGEVIEMKSRVNRIKDAPLISDSPAATSSSTLRPTGDNDMVGFHDDLIAIMDRLTGGPSNRFILPVVGVGGVGKTILARNVYDNSLIVNHFDIRAWVTMSQHYNLEEILSGLLVSMGVREKIPRSSDKLIETVYKCLCGRRYLIVMDDVWSLEAWDCISRSFPDHGDGSRIMLTTRLSDLAFDVCGGYYHEMRLMDDCGSWDLLRYKVFGYGYCPDELEDIGKEIARKCRGLPLSIVLVAKTLSTISQTRASWESIAESVISAVATKDGPFEMMLSSSYTQLPHHLKPCLLYMVGFSRDYEIRASELSKLWVAEGFVKPNGSKTLEEVAEEYLEDLVNRSLVLVTGRKFNGKIRTCSLHDVVQDFCIRKVQEEKFLLPVSDYLPNATLRRYFLPQILKSQRRISVTSYDLHLKETTDNSPLRTIICIPSRGYPSMGSVQNFHFLRVLHVVHKKDDWYWVPGQVFELIHLRYLASNIPCLSNIPAAISKLKKLQTLIIYRHDVRLPVEIWRLPKLRHLIAFSFLPLPHPERATFCLEKLQTLSLTTNFVCGERILEMIPNLRKLAILYSEYKFDEDYHVDNLRHLHQLEKLELEIRRDFALSRSLNLVFPISLEKLTLSGSRLPWTDMTIVGSLPNLEVLKLTDFAFQGDVWETTEGEFPVLKFLLIDNSDLEHWITESSHFPNLKCLQLHSCPRLSEIPSEIGEIPTLERIEIDDRNGSLLDSAERIQQEQQEWGNEDFQVHVKHL